MNVNCGINFLDNLVVCKIILIFVLNLKKRNKMATKTWKIGERCRGGIITTIAEGKNVTIIGKEWDMSAGFSRGSNQSNAKEWCRREYNTDNSNARREMDNLLNDLTTSYYADKILKWIESKVKFEVSYW